jgi:hypothetical protein
MGRSSGVTTALLVVAVAACLQAAVHAMYTSSGPVKLLDAKGFRDVKVHAAVCLYERRRDLT